ncbi:MAG: hypothetical protein ABI462_06395 [Ignavibacteria bacterium]
MDNKLKNKTSSKDKKILDRKKFMSMEMEDRRKILLMQSEELLSHYSNDKEWRDFDSFDLKDEQGIF